MVSGGKRLWWIAGVGALALMLVAYATWGGGSNEEAQAIRQSQSGATEQRVKAVASLARYRSPAVMAHLRTMTRDADAKVAAQAVETYGEQAPKTDAPVFRQFLSDQRPELREATALALGCCGDDSDVPALTKQLLGDPSPAARAAAAHALGRIQAAGDVMPALITALRDPDRLVRSSAKAAITAVTGLNFSYEANLAVADREERIAAIEAWWRENGAGYRKMALQLRR